jgi:hypothetical protein
MADPDVEKADKLWEVRSKGLNYLLIAHAAGLVACLTVLKDYSTNQQLRGIGIFVWLFGLGLVSAIVAVGVLIHAWTQKLAGHDEKGLEKYLILGFSLPSALALLFAIILAICKFGRL